MGDESLRKQYWDQLKQNIEKDNESLMRGNEEVYESVLHEKVLKHIDPKDGGGLSPARLQALQNDLDSAGLPARTSHKVAGKVLEAYANALETQQKLKAEAGNV
jgi:hypothetical protein